MRWDRLFKGLIVAIALLTFILATVFVANASPPMPVGVASYITVNGNPIDDGYLVTIKNENTGETVYDYTENGYAVAGLSGGDGDKITVIIEYNDNIYTNSTIVDTSRATQWVNVSIKTSDNETHDGENATENKKPVIIIPDVFEGYVGEEITFDASQCYDPDGYIIKYEWTFYDYPPVTLTGKIVKKIFNNVCNIIGILTVYDNDYATTSKTFNIVVSQQTENNSDDENENEENNSQNDTLITIPPMPPFANFTYSYNFYNNTLYVNFTSTSYDTDGYIVNWTWTVENELYYGENVTVIVPVINENASFFKLNTTLLVTDNDGLYDDLNAIITINISREGENEEKYHLTIYSEKPVSIKISRNGEVLDESYGQHFDYYLPAGNYEIIYTYNGIDFNKSINLNKNTEILLDTPYNKNKTPAFGLLALVLAFGVIIYVRKKI